jgi:hypothetical protein
MSLETLKNRFLATHVGYFFPEGSNMPIDSKGRPDWDTFVIFIINEATEYINNYTIYDMVQHVPLEMRSLYARRIGAIEKTALLTLIKPKYPKLLMPQGECSSGEERLQKALDYYNKCEENIRECNKVVLDAINKGLVVEEASDPGQKLLCKIRIGISMELTDEEIEAVIVWLIATEGLQREPYKTFRKNTLFALKVLNRFAKENEIRFEDAVAVFKEYLV